MGKKTDKKKICEDVPPDIPKSSSRQNMTISVNSKPAAVSIPAASTSTASTSTVNPNATLESGKHRNNYTTSQTSSLTSDSADDFIEVPRKRRRNSTCSTSSTSSSMSAHSIETTTSTTPRTYTVIASNLPDKYASQKSFYGLLVAHQIHLSSVVVRRGNIATLKCTNPNLLKTLAPLRDYKIQLHVQDPKNPHPSTSNPSFPTLSCVTRNVDDSIVAEDVLESLRKQGLNPTTAWRIRSRATNQPTSLFRILTKCRKTLDTLLSRGFTMFFRHYACEPSNIPSVQPLQCGRCFTFGHPSSSCRLPQTCPRCSTQHSPQTTCPTSEISCVNCKGNHPSFSHLCPARPKEITDPTLAAPKKSIDFSSVDCPSSSESESSIPKERFARVEDVIRFIHLSLVNIFPLQSETITRRIIEPAKQFLKREVAITGYGSKIHYSIKPSHPSRDPKNPWIRH